MELEAALTEAVVVVYLEVVAVDLEDLQELVAILYIVTILMPVVL
jgi:hypothetical protein